LQLYTKKDQVPEHFKTKEQLQKLGKIPTTAPVAKINDHNRIQYLFDLHESAPIPTRTEITLQPTLENLAKALFVVNRHAKTSPNPQKLYELKTLAITKLIQEGKATKVGLQQSPNPSKYHQQTSNTLVQIGEYGFHILSTREDLLELPHLGDWSENFRNPTDTFPLRHAVKLLERYACYHEKPSEKSKPKPKTNKPSHSSSSLASQKPMVSNYSRRLRSK
jgi:hypothetical protein